MFKNFISLVLLITFSFSFIAKAEVMELNELKSKLEKTTASQQSFGSIVSKHHDCNDCNSKSNHCTHHCFIHNIIISANTKIKLNNIKKDINKMTSYLAHHYVQPFIDPSLKPPTHS